MFATHGSVRIAGHSQRLTEQDSEIRPSPDGPDLLSELRATGQRAPLYINPSGLFLLEGSQLQL